MLPRKPLPLDWITVAGACVAGVLSGAGTADLSFAERFAFGVTVGLSTMIVLHIAVRVLRGKRRGP